MIKVSVIIPTYKDWDRLKLCIDALISQTYPQNNFEIIIINNDPEKSNPPYNLPENIQLISEDKPGSYAARNRGIKHAKGDILAFTDSDCIPEVNWLKNALIYFESNQDIFYLGGQIEQFSNGETSEPVLLYQQVFSFNQEKNIIEKFFSVTANLFIRKEIIEMVGLFNEELFSGGDYEFGNRVKKEGILLKFDQNIVVKHPVRSTIKDLIRKKKRTKGGAYDITKKRPSLKYVAACFLDPVIKSKLIPSNVKFNSKLKVLGISWMLKFSELFEWLRLWIFNTKRLRQ
ncbi:MAG: glycosyltransferase [Candidatus Woykebacteria bacterium]